jgi:hypothetical protein
VAAFKGFAHVKKRDELALMWAVAKHGPVAVSLDASQPSFKFYSEGVYSAKHCLTKKVREPRTMGRERERKREREQGWHRVAWGCECGWGA